MVDTERGSNTSCVILSLMGVDDRLIKKLVQGHKRVLSDEYHQRVASTAQHVRLSSFKCNSFVMSKKGESEEASVAVNWNKRRRMSSVEEKGDSLSDERNVLKGKGFVDELMSETYTSHNTTRQCVAFNSSFEPSTSFTRRYSGKILRGFSFPGSRSGNYNANLCSHHNWCCLNSRSSAASSIKYSGRNTEKQNEAFQWRSFIVSNALHHVRVEGNPLQSDNEVDLFSWTCPVKIEPGKDNMENKTTAVLKAAVGEVDDKVEDWERLPRNFAMPWRPTSCSLSERNCCPAADLPMEQETFADSFRTDGSKTELDTYESIENNCLHSPDSVLVPFGDEKSAKLSEYGMQFQSSGFPTSTAWPFKTRTTVLGDTDDKDQCEAGCCELDGTKRRRMNENREFSYLVEVLSAAGFCRRNLASSLGKWHSVESPLSPFIFETVEKRYTDDKSWETSKRLLLFDRINSWLKGTLRPSTFASSRHVLVRIRGRFHQLGEDILWSTLVKEGRELRGESIEDLLECDLRSVDISEFIESIVTEIEQAVINNLVVEIAG
ncbi:hypothetical protein MLD38_003691 [Melastoma candidum]|uniref:Uncharacterized protein n=1 Tax=Melastoma candidum TaxID=119954 RepID=A0ACB9S2L7_9MYRT|nr:hypothetical protein MLD38_003691 [Melastoma candidum]